MLIKNSTRVRKERFTENDVNSRHFVTAQADRFRSKTALGDARTAPAAVAIVRVFCAETAETDTLVEVLYELLRAPSGGSPKSADAASDSVECPTCLSAPAE
jgi:hypothetical protein